MPNILKLKLSKEKYKARVIFLSTRSVTTGLFLSMTKVFLASSQRKMSLISRFYVWCSDGGERTERDPLTVLCCTNPLQ